MLGTVNVYCVLMLMPGTDDDVPSCITICQSCFGLRRTGGDGSDVFSGLSLPHPSSLQNTAAAPVNAGSNFLLSLSQPTHLLCVWVGRGEQEMEGRSSKDVHSDSRCPAIFT